MLARHSGGRYMFRRAALTVQARHAPVQRAACAGSAAAQVRSAQTLVQTRVRTGAGLEDGQRTPPASWSLLSVTIRSVAGALTAGTLLFVFEPRGALACPPATPADFAVFPSTR
jgi:hypothetical protein